MALVSAPAAGLAVLVPGQDPQVSQVAPDAAAEALRGALPAARAAGGFLWLALREPPQGDLTDVAAAVGLPALAVEDAVTDHQRPKLEVYGGQTFVVLRPATYLDDDELVDVAQVAVFLTQDVVVSVEHRPTDVGSRVTADLGDLDPGLVAVGPALILYRVLDLVVDEYEAVVRGFDTDLEQVEDEVFGPDEEDHSPRIYHLKDQVAVLRRALNPLVRPLEQLAGAAAPQTDARLSHLFRDVHDHALRAAEAADLLDRQLSDVLEANTARVTMVQNRIALRQNEDMRKISAWAAMALVPTLIAGIFGMNLDLWPDDSMAWGFPAVLASMVAVCVGLYRAFRRNGWL